MKDLCCRNSKI